MRRIIAVLALVVVASASTLDAQDGASPADAAPRVRVWPADHTDPFLGTLQHYSTDSIALLTSEGTFVLPRDSVIRVEVSEGVYSDARRGLKIGALVGGLAGFGLAYSIMTEFEEQGAEILPAGAAAGAIAGGLVGLGIGALSHSEHWHRATLDGEAARPLVMRRDGRVMLGVAMGL